MSIKKVAILQSNYIPWKGYFNIIGNVDLFIFHDDLQYTSNDWRNRNKIKTDKGTEWLSIPCGTNEKRLICDVELKEKKWQRDHWNKILTHYRKAAYFKEYAPFFEEYYLNKKWENLSDLNQTMIKSISREIFKFDTEFEDSRKYDLKEKKGKRVIELLKKVGAPVYLSGPLAKGYLSEEDILSEGFEIEWMDYSGYPEYPQLYPPFEHQVSVIDLVFNVGGNCREYLKPILK